MLSTYSSILDYREFMYSNKIILDCSQLKRLDSKPYRSACHKLRKLDPALVFVILAPLYSHTGRTAINPFILICSFILMQCKFRFRGTPVSLSLEHLLRNNGTLDSDQ